MEFKLRNSQRRGINLQRVLVKNLWAEFGLRAVPVCWLLILLSLIVIASILVPILTLTFVAQNGVGGTTLVMLPLEALLVRAIGHVARLLVSFQVGSV